jgi:hypothetical protein
MKRRRRARQSVRWGALAVCAAVAIAAAGMSAHAIEPPPGSRNFTTPTHVPNYFSNEATTFQGGAGARAAQPGADQFNAAAPEPRSYSAGEPRSYSRKASARAGRGKYRGSRVARGKVTSSRYAARAGAARSGKVAVVRGRGKSVASKAVATRSRPTASLAKHASRGGR